ncbi:reverse transcriptase [Trichonephila clavipes]|nr:reverse transcriptase [Trichonephila clavipes]
MYCLDPKNQKLWKTLATVGPNPRYLESAEVVAHFRLTTGHDPLGVYLHWLGVAAKEACSLCGHAGKDGDHLLQTSSVSTGKLDVKWSRSQPRALDK